MTVAPPEGLGRTAAAHIEGLTHGLCLGLSAGFYLWILGGPRPADHAIVKMSQPNLLVGVPMILAGTLVTGIVLGVALGASEVTRTWRKRVALGSCALYLAATSVAIGHLAVVLAPAAALTWVVALTIRHEEPTSAEALITLNAALFGTAVAFFHQWSWYRAGWEPFFDSILAVKWLLTGD
jgi:hypothetical protein